ncbi:MAG TPA: alpha/beta hydrolase [Vicinamibacterales bacterium]|jgi:pimeloyl-ACP methyl ester carboxylesterase|nr:alpha/beta hydrolase [Vicinamibacterales bacterium]
MPRGFINGVNLYYEEAGHGVPMIFVHEFAGEARSWAPQVRFFRRWYRTITFNARGYPPSDVPEDPAAYSQRQAVEDIRGVLDYLQIDKAHVVGLSMGGYAALHFGLLYPERALSLVVAGAGYGSKPEERETFRRDCAALAERFEREPMESVAAVYAMGPARVQFRDKDAQGWEQFRELLTRQSAQGHALTMRRVQIMRESIYELGDRMARLTVPTLIVTGDEDDACLEPALYMKRTISTAGLLVIPRSGHTINLEEPDVFNRHVLDFITAVDRGRWTSRNPASVSRSAILPADWQL